jgi:hypothetical protein
MSWQPPTNLPEPGQVVRCHGYFKAYRLGDKWYADPGGEVAPVLWTAEPEKQEEAA